MLWLMYFQMPVFSIYIVSRVHNGFTFHNVAFSLFYVLIILIYSFMCRMSGHFCVWTFSPFTHPELLAFV